MNPRNKRSGKALLLPVVFGSALLSACSNDSSTSTTIGSDDSGAPDSMFEAPVKLMAAGKPIRVPSPGYAAPAWHDVTEDGLADLIVGQFSEGLMGVYPQNSDGSFAKRQWIQADGEDAKVPGVW